MDQSGEHSTPPGSPAPRVGVFDHEDSIPRDNDNQRPRRRSSEREHLLVQYPASDDAEVNAQLLRDGNWVVPQQELERDYWNQSMKLGIPYDDIHRNILLLGETAEERMLLEDEEERLRDEMRNLTQSEVKATTSAAAEPLEATIAPNNELTGDNASEKPQQAGEDEEDDEAEGEADDRAIDEMIGLDEEFAGEDAPPGASRMHEAAAQPPPEAKPLTTQRLFRIHKSRYGFTWPTFRLLFRLGLALGFGLTAIFVPSTDSYSEVASWRWFAFASVLACSYDACRLFIVGLLLVILSKYWYSSNVLKNAHYYVHAVRWYIIVFLCSVVWIVAWWALIGLARPSTESWNVIYDYVTRMFGALVVWFFFLAIAAIAKEVAESMFERTTHWNDVERMLKCEYFLWRLASQGSLFPHDVVAAFVLSGWRATKADPKVLRQCTRYLSKSPITAYDASGDPIHISDMEEAADFGVLMFQRVVDSPNRDFAEDFKQSRQERDDQKKRMARAYGFMLHGRTRLSLNSMATMNGSTQTVSPATNLQSSGSAVNGLDGPTIAQPAGSEALKDKRRVKFEAVEKAYTPYGALPQYAPDALYGWSQLLDVARRGHGSARSFRAAMIRFFQDRANVAATLRDAHAAVERLGIVFMVVANVLALVIAALIFAGSSSYEVWLGLTSFFVAMAVVFGSMLAQVFENIVFLFFRHTFDVGDLIVINDDYYSVRRLELLSTLLLKWSGQYMIVENSWISKQQILNLTRSGLYWQAVNAAVDIATCTPDFIHAVRGTVKQYIQKHPESFSGEFQVCMSDMERPLHVVISLWIEFAYRPNNLERLFQDIGRAHEALCNALRTHGATSSGVAPASIHIGKAGTPNFISSAGEMALAKFFENLVTSGAIAAGPNARPVASGATPQMPPPLVKQVSFSQPGSLQHQNSFYLPATSLQQGSGAEVPGLDSPPLAVPLPAGRSVSGPPRDLPSSRLPMHQQKAPDASPKLGVSSVLQPQLAGTGTGATQPQPSTVGMNVNAPGSHPATLSAEPPRVPQQASQNVSLFQTQSTISTVTSRLASSTAPAVQTSAASASTSTSTASATPSVGTVVGTAESSASQSSSEASSDDLNEPPSTTRE